MKIKKHPARKILQAILQSGRQLEVTAEQRPGGLALRFTLSGRPDCLLHWGLCDAAGNNWQAPPTGLWPQGSVPHGDKAVQTPFLPGKSDAVVTLDLGAAPRVKHLAFVLFFPAEQRWEKRQGKDFLLTVPQQKEKNLINPVQALNSELVGQELLFQAPFGLRDGRQLAAAVVGGEAQVTIHLVTDLAPPLLLHWGLARDSRQDWRLPPNDLLPPGSVVHEGGAVRTPFVQRKDGLLGLIIPWPTENPFLGINGVLFQPSGNQWHKAGAANIFLPLQPPQAAGEAGGEPRLAGLLDEIIQTETGKNSWTLMHRFNLCHDLLDRVRDSVEGLAIIFVWLRYSATRQLTWQRHYNTQPRELSHAQQRLTLKLAEFYGQTSDPACRELLRLILSTVGRGGEGGKGQQVRDGILHIMHRHKIKEVTGHFMEEWHQKLHNNATPDDIVICEAYLAFLHSDGDLDTFYNTLEQGGITRERLRTFERPIVSDPDFPPHLKAGLSHDFEEYLRLLKSIFSATDLLSAMEAAQHQVGHGERDRFWAIWNQRHSFNEAVVDQVGMITRARADIRQALGQKAADAQALRDLIYLDLALEDYLRAQLEGALPQVVDLEAGGALLELLLRNVGFSYENQELPLCEKHWQWLAGQKMARADWALAATAVIERTTNGLGAVIDLFYQLFQAKAEYMGRAIEAQAWTIELFTQEVLRGGPAFVLSQLLGRLTPQLRKIAKLGPWQVISQQAVTGRLEIAELARVQAKKFKEPTILLSSRISGEEEIPPGVVGVVTSAGVDILAHVAVRARNAEIFFATCYDPKIMQDLQTGQGKVRQIGVSGSGVVSFTEKAGVAKLTTAKRQSLSKISCRPVAFKHFAVGGSEFDSQLVGGKSLQLQRLKGHLPDWIQLPRSAAVPFCVCEQAMTEKANQAAANEYEKLLDRVDAEPAVILPRLRAIITGLQAPEQLLSDLQAAMRAEGFKLPPNPAAVMATLYERVREVWASKWTERAYWSRKNWGIPHDCLVMAVLIQEVVPAEYAFVIHTANPFTGDRKELYAELVVGLGETLCSGNYPGRALSFTAKGLKPIKLKQATYPSKSRALLGGGIIARSDSNGEDLENYAGAGLYESLLVEPYREQLIDYTNYPLVVDKSFREEFCQQVAAIGQAVEAAMDGVPQDIEGAWVDGKFYVVQTRTQVGI